MTDPRTPEPQRKEDQLPDALDQTPEAHEAQAGREGSEDAQLLAEADQGEGDVERSASPEDPVATPSS